jgi:hypothetical protein
MDDPAANLPNSTGAVVLASIQGRIDTGTAIAWARDVWERGREDEAIVDLSLLSEHDYEAAGRLLPKAVSALGLNEPEVICFWAERELLHRLLSSELDTAALLRLGNDIWSLLADDDRIGEANPLSIYNDLHETTHGRRVDREMAGLPPDPSDRRAIEVLVTDGAFERAGLQPPTA